MRYAGADRSLLCALHAWGRRRPAVAAAARTLSYAGEHGALWLAAGLTAAAADPARRTPWLRATTLTATAHLAAMALKPLARRPRPAPGPAPVAPSADRPVPPAAPAPGAVAPVVGSALGAPALGGRPCPCEAPGPAAAHPAGAVAPGAAPGAGALAPVGAGAAAPEGGGDCSCAGPEPWATGPGAGAGGVALPCSCTTPASRADAAVPSAVRGQRRPGRVGRGLPSPVVGRYSFPSSHAASAAAAAVAFGAVRPGVRWVGVPVAAAMCVSRLVVGVHYPTDVAAGALLGAVTAWRLRDVADRFCTYGGSSRRG
ncbi:phosphatase PAP2 family protein [Streptomyces sp. NPDC049837]|uniref:phosphatase PAP2 family protein n=1 Tax=Streptomyces sp. NPDC049837 TaxID=3155277 RepID=UPI0034290A3E